MANFSENYKENTFVKPFQISNFHTDCQAHSVVCTETMKNVKSKGNYQEIFKPNISKETAVMLEEILKFRKNKLG